MWLPCHSLVRGQSLPGVRFPRLAASVPSFELGPPGLRFRTHGLNVAPATTTKAWWAQRMSSLLAISRPVAIFATPSTAPNPTWPQTLMHRGLALSSCSLIMTRCSITGWRVFRPFVFRNRFPGAGPRPGGRPVVARSGSSPSPTSDSTNHSAACSRCRTTSLHPSS